MDFNLLQTILLGLSAAASTGALMLTIKEMVKKESSKHKKEEVPEYQSLVKDANQQASSILNQATTTAGNIISDAHKTNEAVEEDLDRVIAGIAAKDINSIDDATKHFEKSYAKQLENLNQKLQKMTFDSIQDTQKGYIEQVAAFSQELLKNGLSTQTMVDKKTAELVTIADQEIDDYKKQRLEKIDEQVKEMVEKVYRQVLKSSISENLQNELILKSLDEAKKDGIFNL